MSSATLGSCLQSASARLGRRLQSAKLNITGFQETASMDKKIRIEHHSLWGGAWFAAWLFTLGYLDLGFLKGVLAIVLWPYFLGDSLTD